MRKRPTPAGWFSICGQVTRLVVLDIEAAGIADDGPMGARIAEVLAELPETCKRTSPNGGVHAWVTITEGAVPTGRECRLVQKIIGTSDSGRPLFQLLAEFRGHGQYAVMLGHGRGRLSPLFAPVAMTQLGSASSLSGCARCPTPSLCRGRSEQDCIRVSSLGTPGTGRPTLPQILPMSSRGRSRWDI